MTRVLIVGVSTYATAGTPGAVSVTYGGVALTRQGTETNTNTAVEIWRATESQIASRANDSVVVTLGAGVTQYAVGGSASFYGVNQTTPNRNFIGNTGNTGASSTNDPSVTVPSASRELVIDTVATEFTSTNILSVGTNQTERWNGATDSDCDGSPALEPNLTLNSVGAGSTESGAASVPMTWNASANNVNWAIGAVSLIPLALTEVELTSFDAVQVGGGNLVRWETGYEVDNLGFNLYREVKGKRTRVNPSLVAGSAFLAGQGVRMTAGRSYRWLDRQATAGAQYWLEDVDLNGERKLYGPIAAEAKEAGGSGAELGQSLMLAQLNSLAADGASQARLSEHPTSLNSFMQESAASSSTAQDRQREIAQQAAIKLLVNHNGWYRVGQQELVAAGLDPGVGPRWLQLYADGVEVPLLVNSSTGSQFGPGDSIEFYGMGLDTASTDTRTYWLVVGTTPGARIRKTKVRSLGRPTITAPLRPAQPSQPASSPAAASPATTGGTGSAQQGSTLFNWLPALPMPTLTTERQIPASVQTRTAAGTTLGSVNRPATATTEADAVSPATEATAPESQVSPRTRTAARPDVTTARSVVATAPSPITSPITTPQPVANLPAANKSAASAQPTIRNTEPAMKRSAGRRRAKRGVMNRKRQRAAARRKLRSHAASSDAGAGVVAESFDHTVERADRAFYFSALQNGEASNFFGQIVGQEAATLKLNVHHLAKSTGQSTLEVSLQGATVDNHLVSVRVNGSEVGQLSFAGRSRATQQFAVANSLLRSGENTVVFSALGGQTDISLVDRVSISYAHTYEADNNALAFSLERGQEVNVSGFSSPGIRLLDISDPLAPEELVVQAEAAGGGYSLAFESSRGGTLLALANSQVERPAQIIRNRPSSWHRYEQGADLLILAHRDFINALAPLVSLRQSQGLAVAVIDVEDIYDEFSYGAHSRAALRDFLDWTRSHWPKSPRFVLLVGDCSYDPRNFLGHGQLDFVPTSLIDTRSLETASDDALADFDNDGVPEMAVGRLPVRTAAEAATVVSKIVAFQNGNLRRGALLVSDQVTDFDFEAANRAIRALLPQGMDAQLVNRGSNDTSAVRSQIISAINQGPLLVNYLGHGSIESWTGAGILRSADAAQLTNDQALSVFVLMTCLNGFVQDVSSISLGEALMRNGNGGAAAVWASSGLTEPDQQALMNQQLVRSLLGEQPLTLGEAVLKAKGATRNIDVRRTWILLGDPTTRLR